MNRAKRLPCLALLLLATTSARPVYGPGPAYDAGTIEDARYGFSFDLPQGLVAEHAPDIPEYWIGPEEGGMSITLAVEAHAWTFPKSALDRDQWLLAYALRNLATRCDYDGEYTSGAADSLLSPRSFRTPGGLAAVEYFMRVREEFYGYGAEYKGGDSTAVVVDGSPASSDDPDSFSYSRIVRTAGPEYLVDITTPDRPAIVRVEFNCEHRPDSTTLRLGRAIVNSIRLGKSK